MAAIRLNGWQRLWVVVTILWGFATLGGYVALFPKESEVWDRWAARVIAAAEEDIAATLKIQAYQVKLRARWGGDASDRAIAERITEVELDKVETPKTADRRQSAPEVVSTSEAYRKKIASLATDRDKDVRALSALRLQYLGIALAAWLVPCILFYLIGMAVGWIWRGFFPPSRA